MYVRDVMTSIVRTIDPSATPKEAAAHLRAHAVSGMPVVDRGGNLLGVVSTTDLLRAEAASGPTPVTVGELMTAPAITIAPNAPLGLAARLMVERDLSRLPVVSGDALVGIVSRGDLVGVYVQGDEEIEARFRELAPKLLGDADAIEIAVAGGHVELRGQVPERELGDVLVEETRRIPRVRSVHSTLRWPRRIAAGA
jgi:CBS domain-containing protein